MMTWLSFPPTASMSVIFKKFASFIPTRGLAPVYDSKVGILTGRINSDLPSVN